MSQYVSQKGPEATAYRQCNKFCHALDPGLVSRARLLNVGGHFVLCCKCNSSHYGVSDIWFGSVIGHVSTSDT